MPSTLGSRGAPDRMAGEGTVRLVVVQGPLQALTACAAICHAERTRDFRLPNVMLFGGILADDRSGHYGVVLSATMDCLHAIDLTDVIEFIAVPDEESLRGAMSKHGEVAEIVCGRNWHDVNKVALGAFPEAFRIVVGDGLGVLDVDLDPAKPQFQLAMPIVPLPLTPGALDRTELEIVPREVLLDVIAIARERSPDLRELDGDLAEFARGGTLLIMNYMTEAYDATLTGEIDLAVQIMRGARRTSTEPVVIKPHPRSSLGQAAAVARALRSDGHPVRIMGQFQFGHHPIELFERLLRAVDAVHTQGSSSALSIKYLFGVSGSVALPRRQARRALLPRQRNRVISGAVQAKRIVDAIDGWDGRSVMHVNPQWQVGFLERALGRLTRPITWKPAGSWRRRTVHWKLPQIPSEVKQSLGTRDLVLVPDEENGIAWVLPRADAASLDTPSAPSSSPAEAVAAFLERASKNSWAIVGAVVATTPSTHAPAWQCRWRRLLGIKVVENARLSAEYFEDLLELRADIVLRVPEVGRSMTRAVSQHLSGGRSSMPAGYVAFAFRPRPTIAADHDYPRTRAGASSLSKGLPA